MRNFKATLLFAVVTSILVLLVLFSGRFLALDIVWKGLLHITEKDVAATPLLQSLIIVVIAFFSVAMSLNISVRRARLSLVLFASLLLMTGSFILALYHFFITPFAAELALWVGYILVLFYMRTASGARQPILQQLFGQRLQRRLLRKLIDSSTPVEFLGELKNGSVLICSINNHAELMEALPPEEYVAMTNLYLRTASDFLVDVGGYLDECSGESIRVVFGLPEPVIGAPNHGAKAARAALDLAVRLDDLNRECDARWQKRLDIRIGINSGEMIAAIYKGNRLGHYSVAGSTVEFARYLCSACINYGCRILVSPTTYELAQETVEFRPIDLLQRKGIRRRVELYEVLAPKNTLSAERERSRDLFWKGVIFFRGGEWDQAINAFAAARIPGIVDQVLDLYLERVDRARRGADELSPERAVLTQAI